MSDAQQHYALAQQLHGQGRYAEAEQHYRQVIALFGDYAGALTRLGEVCFHQRRFEEAAGFYERAAKVAPEDAAAHGGLACTLNALGRHEDALRHVETALTLAPGNPGLLIDKGNALVGLRRDGEAVQAYLSAAQNPATALPAHYAAGNCLVRLARFEEAGLQFQAVLGLRPDHLGSLMSLGAVLLQLEQTEQAIICFERAIRIRPDLLAAHYSIAATLQEMSEHQEAIEWLRKIVALDPRSPRAHNLLGRSLSAVGDAEAAWSEFDLSLRIDANNPDTYFEIGQALRLTGRFDEAHSAFERATALAPDVPMVWHSWVSGESIREGHPAIAALEKMASDLARHSDSEQVFIHFALGKVYDDLKRHDAAFSAWQTANATQRRVITYDEAAAFALFKNIAERFSAEFITHNLRCGDASALPVFIVGMPRSGTTLVEQMLASHPQVFGAGEVANLGRLYDSLGAGDRALTREELKDIGQRYVEKQHRKAPDALRITDKMPGNFASLGLIATALPNARIIHTTRNPLDMCFSCYTHLFNVGHQYTYDLGELGRYYRAYEALMEHWRATLPKGMMLEVSYEGLVGDFEGVARRIVEFCDLAWDDRCLAFHETKRPVETASAFQVRRPLYRGSVGRAQPYLPWLEPLRAALDGS